jgi:hypothetical protein
MHSTLREWLADWSDSLRQVPALMFQVDPSENQVTWASEGLFLLVLGIWGARFLFNPLNDELLGSSWMHLVHLPFHEAGHVVFSPFGRFMQVLGGTLGQLLVPLIVAGAFLLKANPFGASVGLWWLGQSLMDCGPYINDARAGQLELLGGVTGSEMPDYHDWEVLLGKLGWLQHDHLIAKVFWGMGALVMVAALAWGGYVLYQQWRLRQALA